MKKKIKKGRVYFFFFFFGLTEKNAGQEGYMTYTLGEGFAVSLDKSDIVLVVSDGDMASSTDGLYGGLLLSPVVLSLWLGEDVVEVVVVEVDRSCRAGGKHGG